MAYCSASDLLIGDIPLPAKYGDGAGFVSLAADEIDAQIGHIYVTPVVFAENTSTEIAAARPAKLLLKKINILLASGRIILDMAAGAQDDSLHSYGASMRNEALNLLRDITSGRITLHAAPLLAEDASTADNAVIHNEDPYSLVEGFYTLYREPFVLPGRTPVMRPYDDGVYSSEL